MRKFLYRPLPDLWCEPYSKLVGAIRCAALVNEGDRAEIDIVMLRPEPSGAIITGGGDIDNRLKTLLDALRMPRTPDELPDALRILKEGEEPKERLLCLLEDDRLVSGVSVRTHELLEPSAKAPLVVLVMQLRTKHVSADEAHVGMLRDYQYDV